MSRYHRENPDLPVDDVYRHRRVGTVAKRIIGEADDGYYAIVKTRVEEYIDAADRAEGTGNSMAAVAQLNAAIIYLKGVVKLKNIERNDSQGNRSSSTV